MQIKRPPSKQPMPEHAKRVFKGVIFDVYQSKKNIYFAEQEITLKLMEAKIDREKRRELEELFRPV